MAESKTELALASARATISRIRSKTDARAAKLQRLGVAAGAAWAVGAYEKSQRAAGHSADILGVDIKLGVALAAYVGGEMVGGRTGELLEDAGIGVLAAWAHKEGST